MGWAPERFWGCVWMTLTGATRRCAWFVPRQGSRSCFLFSVPSDMPWALICAPRASGTRRGGRFFSSPLHRINPCRSMHWMFDLGSMHSQQAFRLRDSARICCATATPAGRSRWLRRPRWSATSSATGIPDRYPPTHGWPPSACGRFACRCLGERSVRQSVGSRSNGVHHFQASARTELLSRNFPPAQLGSVRCAARCRARRLPPRSRDPSLAVPPYRPQAAVHSPRAERRTSVLPLSAASESRMLRTQSRSRPAGEEVSKVLALHLLGPRDSTSVATDEEHQRSSVPQGDVPDVAAGALLHWPTVGRSCPLDPPRRRSAAVRFLSRTAKENRAGSHFTAGSPANSETILRSACALRRPLRIAGCSRNRTAGATTPTPSQSSSCGSSEESG